MMPKQRLLSNQMPSIWVDFDAHVMPNNQCDCDCACPESMNFSARPEDIRFFSQAIANGTINKIQTDSGLYQQKTGPRIAALSTWGTQIVVYNHAVRHLIAILDQPRSLTDLKRELPDWPDSIFEETIAILLATGVLISLPNRQALSAKNVNDVLSIWLQLTNQCNLACSYCYTAQNKQKMTEETAEATVQAVFRSAQAYNYQRVKLKYAGGEPTLNFDVLIAAQREAERLSLQSGIALSTVLLTNGVHIADGQIDFLIDRNIQVMLSLDGLEIYHDQHRSDSGGQGSFEKVRRTLNRFLDRDLKPHISITITRQSIEGLPDLVDYLLERHLTFSFNFYRQPNNTMAPDKHSIANGDLIDGLLNAYKVIERRLPPYGLIAGLSDRANLRTPHLRTCGVGQSYMVVDCQGHVSKCQMEQSLPLTTIQTRNPLATIRHDTEGLLNVSVNQIEACRSCPWRYRCSGGCPRLTPQFSQQVAPRSPLCDVYKAILPQVITLEALRLLRYHDPWASK